jgi:sarcosine oxidase
VRLADLAYRAWAELEWEAGERLLVTTGGLDLFPPGAAIPPGHYRASLEACGVPYQWLDAAEVMRRWPAFRLDPGVHGLWQADTGMVPAARATRLMQRLAAGYGATLADRTPVTAVRDLGGEVEVATAEASFRAGRVLLCTDAWTGDLLAQVGAEPPLVVTQEQFSYFRPADAAAFAVGRFPGWIWMDDPSFYGFPVWPDAALTAAQDLGGRRVTATTRGFDPDPAATYRLAGFLRARLPSAGAHQRTATCLYTLTPTATSSSAPSRATTASWSPSAPPTPSSSPPSWAGSWPTWPCTTAPTSTSPRSPLTGRRSPPPAGRPPTWSDPIVRPAGQCRQNSLPSGSCMTTQCWPASS